MGPVSQDADGCVCDVGLLLLAVPPLLEEVAPCYLLADEKTQ